MNGSYAKDVGYTAWPSIVQGEVVPERVCYRKGVKSRRVEVIRHEKKNIVGEVTKFRDSRH